MFFEHQFLTHHGHCLVFVELISQRFLTSIMKNVAEANWWYLVTSDKSTLELK